MQSTCVVVLALAVFGASAHTINLGYGGNLGTSNAVLDYPSMRLSEFAQPSVLQTPFRNFVRPAVGKEVFAFPSAQRFVQTAPLTQNTAFLRPEVPSFQLQQVPGVFGSGCLGGISGGFPLVNEGFIGNAAPLAGLAGSTYPGVVGSACPGVVAGEFAGNSFLPGSSFVEAGRLNCAY